jgi:putative peptidoglycan lipid II flippase
MLLLRRALNARIGKTGLAAGYVAKLWAAAALGAAIAWALKLTLPPFHPIPEAVFVLLPYGLVFVGAALLLRIPEASSLLLRFRASSGKTSGSEKK